MEEKRKKLIEKKTEELGMTVEEIQKKLEAVVDYNFKIKNLLEHVGDWTTWNLSLIDQINEEILNANKRKKTTCYFYSGRYYNKDPKFKEKSYKFTDDDLHINDFEEEVVVKEVKYPEENVKHVYYEDKYDDYEKAVIKLKEGKELKDYEIEALVWCSEVVYQEEGELDRWTREVSSIIKIEDDLWCVNWSEGLTEMQENIFWQQPFKVKLEEKEVVIKKTMIIPINQE